jgi:hypothetical protein
MAMIDGMDTPPKRLADRLGELEALERELQKNLDDADIKAKKHKPASEAYERFAVEFATRRNDAEYRGQVRLAVREIVGRISVELGNDRYTVHFRGVAQPITVTQGKGEPHLFDIAPADWKSRLGS